MQQVHLAILIHGLQGNPTNVAQAKAELIKHHRSRADQSNVNGGDSRLALEVFVPKGISGVLTFDGIELGAVRIAEEVDAELLRLLGEGKQVQAVSIMGYSLGGLMARYLAGLLESRSPSFFDEHRPASFSTIATPHIGMPRYGTRVSTIQHLIGGHLFSRTGRELFCWDKFSDNDINASGDERCLLEVMSDPNSVFMRALKKFKAVRIIANGCYDLTVPYPTAAITDFDPFDNFDRTGLDIEVDDNHIVKSWRIPEDDSETGRLMNGHAETREETSLDGIVREANDYALANGKGNGVGKGQVGEKRKGKGGQIRKRPRLPPPLQWRFPINVIIFTLLPILIPIVIVFLTVTLIIARVKSQLRLRRHHSAPNRKAIAVPSNGHGDYALPPNGDDQPDLDDSQSLLKRDPSSLSPIDSTLRSKSLPVRLLLSDSQKRMIKNFNRALPHAERVIAWFPSAYNSHATIIVRDPKRWPHVEEGRGVLRDWAKFVNTTAA